MKKIEEHPDVNIKKQHTRYNWLPDFVYGGIDGSVTTFAVVAGVVGASLSAPIILILGFANLFADGFSMATGKYLSDKSNREQYKRIQEIEFMHLDTKPKKEREEVEDILMNYGFKGADLKSATDVITSDPHTWVDIMMKHEFNMSNENIQPIKGALATFGSFITIGFIPLIVYTFSPLFNFSDNTKFLLTCLATIIALFIVGAIKSKFSTRNWLISGIETSLIGGVAATIAYLVGFFLKTLAT